MDDICGRGLLDKLFKETSQKANNVLFLHPQLALCGLVHTVDEEEMMFGYSHVPSMKNVVQLAAHALGRTGRPQAIVMNGGWTPTLIQATIASIHDALSEGAPLRWADSSGVSRLQAVLHLLMLFSTFSGKYSSLGISITLAAPPGNYKSGVRSSLSTLWLYPDLLTSLLHSGEMTFILNIPVFQHLFAAPSDLLHAFLPASFLAEYPPREDSTRWLEFVEMFSVLGFDDLNIAVEACLHTLSLVLLLLDTVFEPGNPRMLENINAMVELLGCNIATLIQGLKPYLTPDGRVSGGFPEAIFLTLLGWVRDCCSGPLTAFQLPKWPFTVQELNEMQKNEVNESNSGVSVVVMPQSAPSFIKDMLPECLAPDVLLANIAAEHLSVWAAKTLLPEDDVNCCGIISELLAQKPSPQGGTKTVLGSLLAGEFSEFPDNLEFASFDRERSVLVVHHTHKSVSYPLFSTKKHAHQLVDDFLFNLANFLAPLLASDALFTHHVPVYVSSSSGTPELFQPLVSSSVDDIENSVFMSAARQLFSIAKEGSQSPSSSRAASVPRRIGKPGQKTQNRRKEEVEAQIAQLKKELKNLGDGEQTSSATPHSERRRRSQQQQQQQQQHQQQTEATRGSSPRSRSPRQHPPPQLGNDFSNNSEQHTNSNQPQPVKSSNTTSKSSNPLSGSMASMVHLTKSFRLRQASSKRSSTPTASRQQTQDEATKVASMYKAAPSDARMRSRSKPKQRNSSAKPTAKTAKGRSPLSTISTRNQSIPTHQIQLTKESSSPVPSDASVHPLKSRPVPTASTAAFTKSHWQDMISGF